MEPYRTLDQILAARLKSIVESLRTAKPEEVHEWLREIFVADPLHPWMEAATRFVEEHPGETAYRAETSDGVGLVFYPRKGGMWYILDAKSRKLCGVGIVSENNMKRLSKLVAGSQPRLS